MEKTEGKIRYGLIGIGAQGGSYARFLTNAPAPFPGMVCAPCPDNCALGALCDIDPEKEKMCKEQYPDVPFFKDWKDMIASGTVDAIITTVPHYLHHEISIYAMEHGMNVLCEKPAGVRSKDVQKMIACAKAHPEVSFGIMFNQRTNKLYQKIKEIVLCAGNGAKELALEAFHLKDDTDQIILENTVSRKKQLIPALMQAIQQ